MIVPEATVTPVTATFWPPEPPVTVVVTVPGELNCHPLGAVRINVPPAEKPLLTVSVRTIFPNVVHCGEVAFAALSAEMFVPPLPAVTVT